MSISTNVYLVKQHEIEQFQIEVIRALKKGFGELFIEDSVNFRDCRTDFHKTNDEIFMKLSFHLDYENEDFSNNKECRSIYIFHYPNEEMKRNFYGLNFNLWGHSKEIANHLVDYFGGYTNYNDCNSIKIDYCISQVHSFLGVRK